MGLTTPRVCSLIIKTSCTYHHDTWSRLDALCFTSGCGEHAGFVLTVGAMAHDRYAIVHT